MGMTPAFSPKVSPLKHLKIGSRTSALAMAQTHFVAEQCKQANPQLTVEIIPIETIGDKRLDKSLGEVAKEYGDKGLFVKELEEALLDGRIDVAIHSMKDMMTTLPDGLAMCAITQRADPRDVWVAGDGKTQLLALPEGARIGTSSIRRVNRLKQLRPDIHTIPVRGNVNTRLRKLAEGYQQGTLDGLILAGAGLTRLDLTRHITQWLDPFEEMLPAPAQGVLAAEFHADNHPVQQLMASIQHSETNVCASAERAALKAMESGCHVPFAAYSQLSNGTIHLTIQHIHPDEHLNGLLSDKVPMAEAEKLGERLGHQLKQQLGL